MIDADEARDSAAWRFIERWERSGAAERANHQLFLSELCDIIDVPRPNPATEDDSRNDYVFERSVVFRHGDGATSTGRIDLHTRGCLTLEDGICRQRTGSDYGISPLH